MCKDLKVNENIRPGLCLFVPRFFMRIEPEGNDSRVINSAETETEMTV